MPHPTFEVTCKLSFESFDDVRAGRAAARSATAELRRLVRHDRRVSVLRCRHRRSATAIRFRVSTDRQTDARELAVVLLRTSVHATGGSTAGWNQLHVAVSSGARTARDRHPDAGPIDTSTYRFPQSWADHAAAVERLAQGPELPALAGAGSFIDLR